MCSSSESDMISKKLQNLDLIYYNVNLMAINIGGKLSPNIVKYCHLSPSGNQALEYSNIIQFFKNINNHF